MPEQMNATVDAMFTAAAGVLGSLADRPVSAGAAAASHADASLKIEKEFVATLTEIPAAGLNFVTTYKVADFARVIGLMLGSPVEGEMDAMQMSIVSETVGQISTSMGEHLAGAIGTDPESVKSDVVTDSTAFPAPPYESFTSALDIGGEFTLEMTIDFDGVALAKMDGVSVASGTGQEAAAAQPAASPKPAMGAGAAASRRAPPQPQPVGFTSMAPTPLARTGHANLDLVHDVPLQISAVLGRTALSLRDVVALQTGSVFELDKLSTDPIDLYVNNILIARGEVVVVDDKFAVKISELNPTAEKV
jgi:flagellar motor switch protein FliN